jgi:putative effector of murein hydrolase
MIIGAAIVDAVLFRLDTVRGMGAPLRLPIAGAVFAAGICSGHLIGLQIGAGIHWPPELWAGAVVFSGLIGALLGTLAAGKPADTRPEGYAGSPARG